MKQVLVGGLLVQALAIGSYLFVSRLAEFYALSLVFGLAYGGVMPLYAVLAREYFGPRTAWAGLWSSTWPTTNQSNNMRSAARCCFTEGLDRPAPSGTGRPSS